MTEESRGRLRPATARERIDQAAYELFSRHGTRAVGMDRVIAASGVAKMTLYRHYPTKEQLVLGFLRRREDLWIRGWFLGEVTRRGPDPSEQLLAIFDVLDRWFCQRDFDGCPFIMALLEATDRESRVRQAAIRHLEVVRAMVAELARAARLEDPEYVADQWQILMEGAIIAAQAGKKKAAQNARELAWLVLEAQGGQR